MSNLRARGRHRAVTTHKKPSPPGRGVAASPARFSIAVRIKSDVRGRGKLENPKTRLLTHAVNHASMCVTRRTRHERATLAEAVDSRDRVDFLAQNKRGDGGGFADGGK
jgi:hypothetical protein